MTTKFTPGPWIVKSGPYSSILNVECNGQMTITIVTSATDIDFDKGIERVANAHLIAAAPDLYEALQNMVRLYYSEDRQNQPEQYARASVAALAKARGES